jgi:hypothetical protein
MALDPEISLKVQQPNSLLSMYGDALGVVKQQQEVQAQRQQLQSQNTLRQILSDANNIDPETGAPNANGIKAVMAVDPSAGMKVAESAATIENQRSEAKSRTSAENIKVLDAVDEDVISPALETYDDNLAKLGPDAARATAQETYATARQSLISSGVVPKTLQDQLPTEFDPVKHAAQSKTYRAWKEKQKADKLAQDKEQDAKDKFERQEKDRLSQEDRQFKVEMARIGEEEHRADEGKWQVLHDPKTNTDYRYNTATGQSTTLDMKPYSPQGASKIGGGSARSAAALAAQKYVEDNPNATPDDIASFAAKFKERGAAATAFGTGKQGQQVASFNVSIAHLHTLGLLADALHNGDLVAANKLAKTVQQETGSAAPSNFEAAKGIVGDEIVKAVVGSGGALGDRQKAQDSINKASSPKQLAGVIKTYKDLMAGQVRGLKKEYENSTGLTDFDDKLSDATKAELGVSGGGQPKRRVYDANGNLVQ